MPSAVAMFYSVFMLLNKKKANVLCLIRAVNQWKVDLWEKSSFGIWNKRGEASATTLNYIEYNQVIGFFIIFFLTLLYTITCTESIYECIYTHRLYHLTWCSDKGHISMTSGKADSTLTNTSIQGLISKSADDQLIYIMFHQFNWRG